MEIDACLLPPFPDVDAGGCTACAGDVGFVFLSLQPYLQSQCVLFSQALYMPTALKLSFALKVESLSEQIYSWRSTSLYGWIDAFLVCIYAYNAVLQRVLTRQSGTDQDSHGCRGCARGCKRNHQRTVSSEHTESLHAKGPPLNPNQQGGLAV